MKFRRIAGVLLGLVALAAILLCVKIYIEEDREAAVITFGAELENVDVNTDAEVLLSDVSAIDNQDGDISDRVQVAEKSLKEDSLEIVYVVRDSSGNVALKRRLIPIEESGADNQVEETKEPTQEVETVPEVTEEESTEAEETETDDETEEETASSEIPVLTLTQGHVTLPAGSEFQYGSFVSSITDDKDSYDDLFRNLVITGTYNMNTPGEYELEFWTLDSDGHQSEREKFRLTVE